MNNKKEINFILFKFFSDKIREKKYTVRIKNG